MADRIQHRRDTAERWATFNPILLEGEIGYVLDNPNQHKIGDGVHTWNELPTRGFTGNISQDTGDDENAVMSQKATTEKLSELGSEVGYNINANIQLNSGESNVVTTIEERFNGGEISVVVDKSKFPSDVLYKGCQIRDDKNNELATSTSERFRLSIQNAAFIKVGFYFERPVSTNITISFVLQYYDNESFNKVLLDKIDDETKKRTEDISRVENIISKYSIEFPYYIIKDRYVGGDGNWATYKGSSSMLIPTESLERIIIVGKEYNSTIVSLLDENLDMKNSKANLDDSVENQIRVISKQVVEIDIKETTKYISIVLINGVGMDAAPQYIGVKTIENNSGYIRNLEKSLDYDEIINGVLIGDNFWWENEQTEICAIAKIDISNYDSIEFLNTRNSVVVMAILKEEPIKENGAILPFADGFDGRIYITDTLIHKLALPSNAKYLYVDVQSSNGIEDGVLPYVWLKRGFITQLKQEISNIKYYNIGNETVARRFESFDNYQIIGVNALLSIIVDNSGNYDTPPIEISGGIISDVTVKETGLASNERPAYCVHSDSNNNIDNELIVKDAIFESSSNACWGVGTRKGYKLTFINCVFRNLTTNKDVVASGISGVKRCWYSHNTSGHSNAVSKDERSIVSFIGCRFISEDTPPMYLQEWTANDTPNDTDFCEFVFIGNTFSWNGNTEDSVTIDYKSGTQELNSKEFKRHFILSEKSTGNNVSWLNFPPK